MYKSRFFFFVSIVYCSVSFYRFFVLIYVGVKVSGWCCSIFLSVFFTMSCVGMELNEKHMCRVITDSGGPVCVQNDERIPAEAFIALLLGDAYEDTDCDVKGDDIGDLCPLTAFFYEEGVPKYVIRSIGKWKLSVDPVEKTQRIAELYNNENNCFYRLFPGRAVEVVALIPFSAPTKCGYVEVTKHIKGPSLLCMTCSEGRYSRSLIMRSWQATAKFLALLHKQRLCLISDHEVVCRTHIHGNAAPKNIIVNNELLDDAQLPFITCVSMRSSLNSIVCRESLVWDICMLWYYPLLVGGFLHEKDAIFNIFKDGLRTFFEHYLTSFDSIDGHSRSHVQDLIKYHVSVIIHILNKVIRDVFTDRWSKCTVNEHIQECYEDLNAIFQRPPCGKYLKKMMDQFEVFKNALYTMSIYSDEQKFTLIERRIIEWEALCKEIFIERVYA